MMILLLGLGLLLASLRFPSGAAAAAVLLVTQATLAFAILAVVYRAGEGRAFWLGFALFGWGYMALTWESWWGHGADRPEMLTSIVLDHLGAWFHRTPDPQTGLWPFTGPSRREIRNRFILTRLDEPVSMSYPNETPFEDVLKYIKAATMDPTTPESRSTSIRSP
jgi:hypothetical protein